MEFRTMGVGAFWTSRAVPVGTFKFRAARKGGGGWPSNVGKDRGVQVKGGGRNIRDRWGIEVNRTTGNVWIENDGGRFRSQVMGEKPSDNRSKNHTESSDNGNRNRSN